MKGARWTVKDSFSLTLRYSLFVKNRDGEYKLWGKPSFVSADWMNTLKDSHWFAFAPIFSVASPRTQRRSLDQQICQEVGLFGLTHDRLLFSDWVQDDSLSVKAVVEVKLNTGLKAFDIEQN